MTALSAECYIYSSELTSVVGICRHLRMAHLTIQRGALYISTALDIIPYYVGLNYTCSPTSAWVVLTMNEFRSLTWGVITNLVTVMNVGLQLGD